MATTLHTAAEAVIGRAVTALMQEAPTETHRPGSSSIVDVLVIGAGQAGLAIGYHLRAAGARFEVIERNLRIGESWRQRYDSLSLFTPRSYSHLPGLLLEGDQEGYPTRDEIADYFARYASHFDIPVRLGTAVVALDRRGGGFLAELDDGTTIDARAVVVASGAFQIPTVPRIAAELSPAVTQLTPLTYRNPSSVPAGVVLVVGDGATGRQIALELAASHRVLLATGKKRSLAPQRLLGRSIFWWMNHLGLLRATGESRLGRRLRARDTIPRGDLADRYLRRSGVDLVPRLTAFDHASATFSDGQRREVGSVVWAAGYRDDTTWLRMTDAVDASGSVLETRGRSPVPGLFFIGRPWQMTQSSGLVTGVGADARTIVTQVVTSLAVSSRSRGE
jgi:putative flavoprotein involved in K+ transport